MKQSIEDGPKKKKNLDFRNVESSNQKPKAKEK